MYADTDPMMLYGYGAKPDPEQGFPGQKTSTSFKYLFQFKKIFSISHEYWSGAVQILQMTLRSMTPRQIKKQQQD